MRGHNIGHPVHVANFICERLLIVLVRTFQYEDWRDLRFAELSSEKYRKGVARLAERLFEVSRQVEKIDIASIALEAEQAASEAVDDTPGFLDRVVSAEEALPKLVRTIDAIGKEIELIGKTMRESASDIQQGDKQGTGFAARLAGCGKTRNLSAA